VGSPLFANHSGQSFSALTAASSCSSETAAATASSLPHCKTMNLSTLQNKNTRDRRTERIKSKDYSMPQNIKNYISKTLVNTMR